MCKCFLDLVKHLMFMNWNNKKKKHKIAYNLHHKLNWRHSPSQNKIKCFVYSIWIEFDASYVWLHHLIKLQVRSILICFLFIAVCDAIWFQSFYNDSHSMICIFFFCCCVVFVHSSCVWCRFDGLNYIKKNKNNSKWVDDQFSTSVVKRFSF